MQTLGAELGQLQLVLAEHPPPKPGVVTLQLVEPTGQQTDCVLGNLGSEQLTPKLEHVQA